jgi:hypothetical protein
MENVSLNEYSQLAINAYRGTSFDPEKRGASIIKESEQELNEDLITIEKATQEEKERYISQYKKRLSDWLSAKSRCLSSMITGPSNFPTSRNEKANNAEHKRLEELLEWRPKALKAIKKRIQGRRPIEEQEEESWKIIKNEILRTASTIVAIDTGQNTYSSRPLFVSSITGFIKRMAKNGQTANVNKSLDLIRELNAKNSKPIITDKSSIWKFGMIAKAVETQKEELSNKEDKVIELEGVCVELSYSDDRIRIRHNEIPSPEVRAQLKRSAFKWSRFNGAWQRQLTQNAIYATANVLNIPVAKITA